MTLFSHIIDALNENAAMSNLDHWFDGFDSAQEAIELYEESFRGETTPEERDATERALASMFAYDVDDVSHAHAQTVIRDWNLEVWGQDFSDGVQSTPFSG